DWKEFGESPVLVDHIEYFVADTPNSIGYTDRMVGDKVTCTEAVAFIETDANEPYRCCDTGERISCLEGDFSSDIPTVDEGCTSELRKIFGVPDTLEGAQKYLFFGDCSGGRFAELTVVQLDGSGRILSKSVGVSSIQVATSVLRCVLGPILLVVILWVLYGAYQRKTAEPVRRF
ncbi:MAG TPA: hypothetical protein DCX53_01705, partial [Anaerolineae bacterium]|nr:hypothetical protein [Anaerolineae bacterium]